MKSKADQKINRAVSDIKKLGTVLFYAPGVSPELALPLNKDRGI